MAKTSKALVVVESPAKVKTINKILGDRYKVVSSMGHVIDLPKSTLGIDIEHDFKPKLIVIRKKQQTLKKLKADAKSKAEIFIATDPDREGEAIGWNLAQEIAKGKKLYRVVFHEITKEAVCKAFEHVREFDQKKIDAQTARRVLDRLVGYQLSPLLWKKVGSGLSAGRVQSVALRLVVERDRQIAAFIPQEYWEITVDLQKAGDGQVITASLEKIKDQKPQCLSRDEAYELVAYLKQQIFQVKEVVYKDIRRNPLPPFITSTLQQEAFNKLGFNTARTMMIAQELYEGIDLGDGETVGLITYMRTDSVNIAQEAKERVRAYIANHFGSEYLPQTAPTYKSKKSAQEAHEAIRPSDAFRHPNDVKPYLNEDQYKVYELIWCRFVSCQMVPALFRSTRVLIRAGDCDFAVSASLLTFDGYLRLDQSGEEKEGLQDLSALNLEDLLTLLEINPSQHFTKPPPRFSEATLVKALEEDGIGRPSTYAPIIQTLAFRNYIVRDKGYLSSTELGQKICDLLIEYFPKVMDIHFTATMEDHLDLIEEGDLDYVKLIQEFYGPFKAELDYAMATIEKTLMLTDRACPTCGKPLAIKWGRRGKFLSCSGFPDCRHAQPFATGVSCPETGCQGEVVERRSKRGTTFYGCSRYPECTFTARQLPKTT